ncbi:Aldehyde ferredoxin oxidoreductase [Pyrolobus fumarii 1A]|uniref:Aldehyde ferredoxin oxidoreductase n=1 Tax=Pyrolobus fumarii (strain DSM 11204 / 1A) TaxID=694429 RepID=G0EHF6_PYRF1|nr:aldehyde ferredoxin oxidoreductase N-terminal domain-containing protein [Pyrolobus fumarii]AEM38531.1 Aldehyde ferredoxin oxidoreductase [Pyrolobus fumarii 1A]
MQTYRVIEVDVSTGSWRLVEHPLGEILGPVDLGIEVHYRDETWRCDPLAPCNTLVLGLGPFTGSPLFGSNRGVAVFRSPLSRTLHVSTVGGIGYKMRGMGAHAIVIRGAAKEPSVLIIEGDETGVKRVTVEALGTDVWRVYGKCGVYSLAGHLIAEHRDLFKTLKPVVLVAGPASLTTRAGAIVAVHYDPVTLEVIRGFVDVAGRGGPGTVMARAHGIVGIVAGGTWRPESINPRLSNRKLIESIARSVAGEPYGKLVTEKTRKYRFDERLGTGGTFGVNYVHYRDLIPMLGYASVYLEKVARLKLYEAVAEYFWKPFQEEAGTNPKKWRTCGEPCPANCKKLVKGTKVDYEPFNALGPFSAIIVFEETRRLVELADEAGVDAIEAGYWVAWVLELAARGVIEPRDACLDERPCWDPILLAEKPRECSARNARLARIILEKILHEGGRGCPVLQLIAERGLRGAARELAERLDTDPRSYTVYAAFGEEGYMTLNLYWTPGLVAPVYVTGKYWTNYSPTFMEPEEFAKTAYERIINEYLVDNAGFCRFHRGWLEKLIQAMYREILGVDKNLREHARRMYARIALYSRLAKAEPSHWETARTRDLVATIAAETGHTQWAERMVKDPRAALDWWERFKRELDKQIGVMQQDA